MNTTWAAPARNWLNTGLGFFYPETCQICKEKPSTAVEGFICGECRKEVRYLQKPFCHRCGLPFEGEISTVFACANCSDVELHFSYARAPVVFSGLMLEVIHRYKYQQALWFEPFLTQLLVRSAGPVLSGEKPDMVVPVPLHPVKEREREFNQAGRLAGHLAAALGVPLNTKVLRRVSFTITQTALSRKDRAANMRGVFGVPKGVRLDGRRIVLVDDVLTTGATTNACAKVLRAAGAAEVCVWTVARGI